MEGTLEEVLRAAYPAWADHVMGYMSGQEDLSEMFRQVNEMILGTLMALLHCQTSADEAGQHNVLKSDSLANLPAVRLYLQHGWPQMIGALGEPLLAPPPDEIRSATEAAFHAGASLIAAIWSQLGLEPEDQDDGSLYLHVYEPSYLDDSNW